MGSMFWLLVISVFLDSNLGVISSSPDPNPKISTNVRTETNVSSVGEYIRTNMFVSRTMPRPLMASIPIDPSNKTPAAVSTTVTALLSVDEMMDAATAADQDKLRGEEHIIDKYGDQVYTVTADSYRRIVCKFGSCLGNETVELIYGGDVIKIIQCDPENGEAVFESFDKLVETLDAALFQCSQNSNECQNETTCAGNHFCVSFNDTTVSCGLLPRGRDMCPLDNSLACPWGGGPLCASIQENNYHRAHYRYLGSKACPKGAMQVMYNTNGLLLIEPVLVEINATLAVVCPPNGGPIQCDIKKKNNIKLVNFNTTECKGKIDIELPTDLFNRGPEVFKLKCRMESADGQEKFELTNFLVTFGEANTALIIEPSIVLQKRIANDSSEVETFSNRMKCVVFPALGDDFHTYFSWAKRSDTNWTWDRSVLFVNEDDRDHYQCHIMLLYKSCAPHRRFERNFTSAIFDAATFVQMTPASTQGSTIVELKGADDSSECAGNTCPDKFCVILQNETTSMAHTRSCSFIPEGPEYCPNSTGRIYCPFAFRSLCEAFQGDNLYYFNYVLHFDTDFCRSEFERVVYRNRSLYFLETIQVAEKDAFFTIKCPDESIGHQKNLSCTFKTEKTVEIVGLRYEVCDTEITFPIDKQIISAGPAVYKLVCVFTENDQSLAQLANYLVFIPEVASRITQINPAEVERSRMRVGGGQLGGLLCALNESLTTSGFQAMLWWTDNRNQTLSNISFLTIYPYYSLLCFVFQDSLLVVTAPGQYTCHVSVTYKICSPHKSFQRLSANRYVFGATVIRPTEPIGSTTTSTSGTSIAHSAFHLLGATMLGGVVGLLSPISEHFFYYSIAIGAIMSQFSRVSCNTFCDSPPSDVDGVFAYPANTTVCFFRPLTRIIYSIEESEMIIFDKKIGESLCQNYTARLPQLMTKEMVLFFRDHLKNIFSFEKTIIPLGVQVKAFQQENKSIDLVWDSGLVQTAVNQRNVFETGMEWILPDSNPNVFSGLWTEGNGHFDSVGAVDPTVGSVEVFCHYDSGNPVTTTTTTTTTTTASTMNMTSSLSSLLTSATSTSPAGGAVKTIIMSNYAAIIYAVVTAAVTVLL